MFSFLLAPEESVKGIGNGIIHFKITNNYKLLQKGGEHRKSWSTFCIGRQGQFFAGYCYGLFFFFLCMSPDETLEQGRNASR